MLTNNNHSLESLLELVDVRDREQVYDESKILIQKEFPETPFSQVARVYTDVNQFFQGGHGFKPNNNPYHDQSHTLATYMTTLRLLDGAHQEGINLSADTIIHATSLALLHDIGMLPRGQDTGLGAEHTQGHENWGAKYFNRYKMFRKPLDEMSDEYVQRVFDSTNLGIKPQEIVYESGENKFVGQIVGSADLLSQMADKFYLEKLKGLFDEFVIAGIAEKAGYVDAPDLMRKTSGFYKMVQQRLHDLGDVDSFAQAHFKAMYGIDRNLYTDAIEQNMNYLNKVIENDGFNTMLRRQ